MPRILHLTRSSAMGLHWLLRRSAVALHCVLPESVNRAAAVVRETDGARWGKATKLLRVSPPKKSEGRCSRKFERQGRSTDTLLL